MGNTVLWKANPKIPTLHYEICKIMHEAGLPNGVLQMIQFAPGTEGELTEHAISHKDVKVGIVVFLPLSSETI